MSGFFSGPMFEKAEDPWRKSVHNRDGGHYNTFAAKGPAEAMAYLRAVFADGEANEYNFCLFSTSGIHGSYQTIEETKIGDEVTFVVVQPRIVTMTYGNVLIATEDDRAFLVKLRASSWAIVPTIGKPAPKKTKTRKKS